MCIDMIRTVLRIVFNHDHSGVLPVRTARHCFNQESQRVVVIGNVKLRRRFARSNPVCVIVRQTHYRKIRQTIGGSCRTLFSKGAKLIEPSTDSRVAAKSRVLMPMRSANGYRVIPRQKDVP